eukprot:sb/3475925/
MLALDSVFWLVIFPSFSGLFCVALRYIHNAEVRFPSFPLESITFISVQDFRSGIFNQLFCFHSLWTGVGIQLDNFSKCLCTHIDNIGLDLIHCLFNRRTDHFICHRSDFIAGPWLKKAKKS